MLATGHQDRCQEKEYPAQRPYATIASPGRSKDASHRHWHAENHQRRVLHRMSWDQGVALFQREPHRRRYGILAVAHPDTRQGHPTHVGGPVRAS